MPPSTPRRRIPVRILLLRPEEGGPGQPLVSGNEAQWNLGHTPEGRLAVDGARIVLASPGPLTPGEERVATLEPRSPGLWAQVMPGMAVPMHQGSQVIGRAVVLAEDEAG